TFFKEELQITDQRALVYLSLYWLGLMMGRMALGPLLRRLSAPRLMLACMSVGFAGAWLLIGAREPSGAGLGVFLLGLGFSAPFSRLDTNLRGSFLQTAAHPARLDCPTGASS